MIRYFEGYSPLHLAIIHNKYEAVKLLLEDSNLDSVLKTAHKETTVILACKHAVKIEILEALLVNLRTVLPSLDNVKEFLEMEDASGIKAYDYCKVRKRSDLAVVLEEFVDTTKAVLDIGFEKLNGFDFKAEAKKLFSTHIQMIQSLELRNQYLTPVPLAPFLQT